MPKTPAQRAAEAATKEIIKTCGYSAVESEPLEQAFFRGCEYGRMNPFPVKNEALDELKDAGMFALGWILGAETKTGLTENSLASVWLAVALKKAGMQSHYVDEILVKNKKGLV